MTENEGDIATDSAVQKTVSSIIEEDEFQARVFVLLAELVGGLDILDDGFEYTTHVSLKTFKEADRLRRRLLNCGFELSHLWKAARGEAGHTRSLALTVELDHLDGLYRLTTTIKKGGRQA